MVQGHMERMILCSEVLGQVLDHREHVHIKASKLSFWTSKIFLYTSVGRLDLPSWTAAASNTQQSAA